MAELEIKTEQDLRVKYKKDTGNYADILIKKNLKLEEDLMISELSDPILFEIAIDFDEIPYLEWLEEKLIYLISLKS